MTEDKDIVDKLKKAGEESGFTVMEGQEAYDFITKEMNKPEHVKAREENERKSKSLLDKFFDKEHKYNFTKEMGEISGFGGDYERGCRAMLIAGLEHLDKNTEANPKYGGYEGVYGFINEENEDSRMLKEAILHPVAGDCTGAMYHAVVSSILYIKKHGWDKYVVEMSKPKNE